MITHQVSGSEVKAAAWHPSKPELVFVSAAAPGTLAAGSLSIVGREVVSATGWTIAAPRDWGPVRSVSQHPWMPWLCIVCARGAVLWDRENNAPLHSRAFARPVDAGGFYPDLSRIWTLPETPSGSVNWGIWKHDWGTCREFELERMEHYGRGAALHPSGLLIGACWSAYACGYLLHRERPDGRLGYYASPAVERSEYEAYAPAFSPDGTQFAMVCNPYLGWHVNHGLVCVYEVETAALRCEFRTGSTSLQEEGLGFALQGRRLAYCVPGCLLRIHEAASGELLHQYRHATTITCSAWHPLGGLYAVGGPAGIAVLVDDEELELSPDSQESQAAKAKAVADRFIAANESSFYAVGEYPDEDS